MPRKITEKEIIAAVKQVYDPEIPVDIYALGLIYQIHIDAQNNVHILMTLTSPSCPAADLIYNQIKENIGKIEDVQNIHVEITFDPPYNPDSMLSEEAKLTLGLL